MTGTNLSLSRSEAEEFLYREARLLDERRFEDWLALFTPDGIYWLPIEEDSDPNERVSLVYDNTARREERIFRLRMRPIQVHSQDPPSKTIHLISNVFVERIKGDEAEVRSSQVVFEISSGHWRPSPVLYRRAADIGRALRTPAALGWRSLANCPQKIGAA